jgi:hypothetical protein
MEFKKPTIKDIWKKYKESDYFERRHFIMSLPFVDTLKGADKFMKSEEDKKTFFYAVVSMIQSYIYRKSADFRDVTELRSETDDIIDDIDEKINLNDMAK